MTHTLWFVMVSEPTYCRQELWKIDPQQMMSLLLQLIPHLMVRFLALVSAAISAMTLSHLVMYVFYVIRFAVD